MTRNELPDIFRNCGAILSSGLCSPVFLRIARVFARPDKAQGYGAVTGIVSPAIKPGRRFIQAVK